MMKKLIFLALFFGSALITRSQATYYVATNGNNANTGTSISAPWRTVAHACSNAPAGSTVYIRGGIYNEQNISVTVSGNIGSPITFKNHANEYPIIDGGGVNQTLFKIENRSYINVEGLHFRNSRGNSTWGIAISGTSHHIQIRKCKISDVSTISPVGNINNCGSVNALPLKVCGNSTAGINNIVIEENEVFNCVTGCSEGISVSGKVTDFKIINNHVHDIGNIGIVAAGQYISPNFYPGLTEHGVIANNTVYRCRFPEPGVNRSSAGIYVDGANRITVEQNRVFECNVGIHLGCEALGAIAEYDTARNNVVYNNDKWGIGMGGTDGMVRYSSLINNSSYYNNGSYCGMYYCNFGEICLQKVNNSSILNNMCYVRYQAANAVFMKWEYPAQTTAMSINYNSYYTPDAPTSGLKFVSATTVLDYNQYRTQTGQDANAVVANPQLFNPTLPHPELHLNENSPLINTALDINAAGQTDYDQNPRKIGGRRDIGAYENQCCGYQYRLFGKAPNAKKFVAISQITSNSQIPTGTQHQYWSVEATELKPPFVAERGSNFTSKAVRWVPIFSDEFNAGMILSQNWEFANRTDYNSNICYYLPNIPQISTHDSKSCLKITATKVSNTRYESGHCKSKMAFSPALNEVYHFQASIKLLAKQGSEFKGFAQTYGAWPAFWTVHQDESKWPANGEIDIMESYSRGTDVNPNAYWASNIHYNTVSGSSLANQETPIGNLAEGWHTYDMYWANDNGTHSVTVLVDNKIVACYKNIFINNMQLQNFQNHAVIFNLNIGSNSTIFNNSLINLYDHALMYVDYIRVRKTGI